MKQTIRFDFCLKGNSLLELLDFSLVKTIFGRKYQVSGLFANLGTGQMASGHGSKSKSYPREHPNPTTKIGSKLGGAFTYPKMGSQNVFEPWAGGVIQKPVDSVNYKSEDSFFAHSREARQAKLPQVSPTSSG